MLSSNLLLCQSSQTEAAQAGERTPERRELDATISRVHAHCDGLIDAFLARRRAKVLSEEERSSYLSRVLERNSGAGDVPIDELKRLFPVCAPPPSPAGSHPLPSPEARVTRSARVCFGVAEPAPSFAKPFC